MAYSARRSSPSGPSAPKRIRAKPAAPASTASSRVATSDVRACLTAVASARRSAPADAEHAGDGARHGAEGHALLLPPVPGHHGDDALGEVAGTDLDPDGHALELPVHAAPSEARVGPVVEADPVPGLPELRR